MFVFLFSDSRIVSHLPFACNWHDSFLDNELVILVSQVTLVGLRTYESHAIL